MHKRFALALAMIPVLSAMPSRHPFLDTTPTPTVPKFSTVHPDNNYSKCLDVRGGVQENGTLVQLHDCNGSKAQKWVETSSLMLMYGFGCARKVKLVKLGTTAPTSSSSASVKVVVSNIQTAIPVAVQSD
ncbi:hypothetical protein CCMSSC00406_0009292 [Pleurotus cornucopiae]|uniref:Uncharacterized protein n=1 Tax=Pleurotus cornucopiae TaxID=5321 RepID=A0ACB7IV18_PLECO|nr:hypothetical protein CCMSSC00406_0009292 [Pleurotus cornucopiae]